MKQDTPTPQVETGQLNAELPKIVIRELAKYCAATGSKKKDIVELAIVEFLERHPSK